MFLAENFHRLLRNAQDGDSRAMEELLAALRPHLIMVARNYADHDRVDQSTSDLVQEAWVRAWRNLGTFAGGADDAATQAKFRVWVSQIVRRVGIDARRLRFAKRRSPGARLLSLSPPGSGVISSRAGLDPAASGPSPSAVLHHHDRTRAVNAALERLPEASDRDIVRLHFFEALSLQEVSRRLGLGYDRVKDRYRSSMKRLERELGPFL